MSCNLNTDPNWPISDAVSSTTYFRLNVRHSSLMMTNKNKSCNLLLWKKQWMVFGSTSFFQGKLCFFNTSQIWQLMPHIGPCYTHKAGIINYEYLYPLHGIGIIELPISNHYLWSCGERVFSITDHRVYKVGLTSRGLSLNETHAISLSISALYHVDVGHRTLCLLDLSLSLSLSLSQLFLH